MIPKAAFIAIAAVMAVSGAFGYFIRGIVDKEKESRKTQNKGGYDDVKWEDDIS